MKNYDLVIHPADGDSGFRTVDVIGCLDSHTVLNFEKALHGLIDHDDVRRLIINLENLNYISSAGISALMGLTHRLRHREGDLVLLKPTEKVFRVFRTLGFTSIFKIVENETEAQASFKG